jgi:hypothetical protein
LQRFNIELIHIETNRGKSETYDRVETSINLSKDFSREKADAPSEYPDAAQGHLQQILISNIEQLK